MGKREYKRTLETDEDRQRVFEEEVINGASDDLNDREKEFCILYSHNHNGAQAYHKAYPATAMENCRHEAWELLRKPKIREELSRIAALKRAALVTAETDLLELHMRIAFSDIKDVVDTGVEDRVVKDAHGNPVYDDDGKPIVQQHSYARMRPVEEIDGQIVQSIKEGTKGIEVAMVPKSPSFQALERYFMMDPYNNAKSEALLRRADVEEKKIGESEGAITVEISDEAKELGK